MHSDVRGRLPGEQGPGGCNEVSRKVISTDSLSQNSQYSSNVVERIQDHVVGQVVLQEVNLVALRVLRSEVVELPADRLDLFLGDLHRALEALVLPRGLLAGIVLLRLLALVVVLVLRVVVEALDLGIRPVREKRFVQLELLLELLQVRKEDVLLLLAPKVPVSSFASHI